MPKKKLRKLVIRGGVGERGNTSGLPSGWTQKDADRYFSERYEDVRRGAVREGTLDISKPVPLGPYGHSSTDVDPEEMRRSSKSLLRYNQELSERSRPADPLEKDAVRRHNGLRRKRKVSY